MKRTQRDKPQRKRKTQSRFFSAIAAFSAIVVIGALAWFFSSSSSPLTSASCRGCNVLLITIDTLRVDRVGAFGGPPGLTPNLDRLAADGVRFTRTYSSV